MAFTKSEQELAELLMKNRILIYGLLQEDAKIKRKEAAHCPDDETCEVFLSYANYIQLLANSISEIDSAITDEKNR